MRLWGLLIGVRREGGRHIFIVPFAPYLLIKTIKRFGYTSADANLGYLKFPKFETFKFPQKVFDWDQTLV